VQIALNRVQRDVLTPTKRTYFKNAFDIGLQTIPHEESRVVVDDGMILLALTDCMPDSERLYSWD